MDESPHHDLQSCPLYEEARKQTWPCPLSIDTKRHGQKGGPTEDMIIYKDDWTSFNTFTRYSFFFGLPAISIPLKEQVPQLCQGKLICYEGVIHSCFSRVRESLSSARCQIE